MTFLPIVGDNDVATRDQQINFLRNHFRYHTMNSWNQSTSYAHCIKIHRLENLSNEDRDKCYSGLDCEESFFDFNNELQSFESENNGFSIGANGRGSGYLVLYRREDSKIYPGRSIDMNENFINWEDDDIANRVDEVRRFDEACESAVAAYVEFCRTHKFVEKIRQRPEKYIDAEEVKLNVDKLDKFTRQYMETALWSSTDDDGNPLDSRFDIHDFSLETINKMIKDCTKFQDANSQHYTNASRAGHDFWLTRSRHGAGFWDGDYPEPEATILTNASHEFKECDLYIGDDGKLHVF